MRYALSILAVVLSLSNISSAATVEPKSPIPPYSLIRVRLQPGERCWILSSTFEPVDAEIQPNLIVWTAPPGKYAVLSWTETSQGQQVVTIGPGGPNPTQAEMSVLGGGVLIEDGDLTPSATDGTDFGTVAVGGPPVIHSFAITNSGATPLNLTGSPRVQILGTGATDFSVTAEPSTPIAGSIGTSSFSVRFSPTAAGLRSASVSIANDDADENPYNFSIQGGAGATPDIKNQFGIGAVVFVEAMKIGKPAECLELATSAKLALDGLVTGKLTPSGAEAIIRNKRLTLSGNWGDWEVAVEAAVAKAMATHGGGALIYRSYVTEIESGLRYAGTTRATP